MKAMKERRIGKNWTIGWYPFNRVWQVRKINSADSDTDFEICCGALQIAHWKR